MVAEKTRERITESNERENKEGEERIGGNIALINFGTLEPMELIAVKKIVGTYVKKISEKCNYRELKLRLKQHKHAQTTLNEIEGEVFFSAFKDSQGKILNIGTNISGYNLFKTLADVLEKLYAEVEHRVKLTKEEGKNIKREWQKEIKK